MTTPAFVQDNSVDSSGTFVTCAYSSPNTAGNASIVDARVGTNATVTVTDSNNPTYTVDQAALEPFGDDTTATASQFNIASGANTVRIAQSASAITIRGAIHEYSGLGASHTAAFDVAVSAANGGTVNTAADSGPVTTTNAVDLLHGAVSTNIGTTGTPGNMGSGSAATARLSIASGKLQTFDKIVSTTGAYRANDTLGAADNWAAVFTAYGAVNATSGLLLLQANG